MTVLPGMPPPSSCTGCEHDLIERDDGTFYPCPTHRPAAFKKWAAGEYPGWRDLDAGPRKVTP